MIFPHESEVLEIDFSNDDLNIIQKYLSLTVKSLKKVYKGYDIIASKERIGYISILPPLNNVLKDEFINCGTFYVNGLPTYSEFVITSNTCIFILRNHYLKMLHESY